MKTLSLGYENAFPFRSNLLKIKTQSLTNIFSKYMKGSFLFKLPSKQNTMLENKNEHIESYE